MEIKFKTGRRYVGTATEIVTQLRKESWFESGLTNLQYRRNFAHRHNMFYEPKVIWYTDKLFVNSLLKSPLIGLDKHDQIE